MDSVLARLDRVRAAEAEMDARVAAGLGIPAVIERLAAEGRVKYLTDALPLLGLDCGSSLGGGCGQVGAHLRAYRRGFSSQNGTRHPQVSPA